MLQYVEKVDQTQRAQRFKSHHYLGNGEFCRSDWTEKLIVSGDLKTSVLRVEER